MAAYNEITMKLLSIIILSLVVVGCDEIIETHNILLEHPNIMDDHHMRNMKLQAQQLERIADSLERMEKRMECR